MVPSHPRTWARRGGARPSLSGLSVLHVGSCVVPCFFSGQHGARYAPRRLRTSVEPISPPNQVPILSPHFERSQGTDHQPINLMSHCYLPISMDQLGKASDLLVALPNQPTTPPDATRPTPLKIGAQFYTLLTIYWQTVQESVSEKCQRSLGTKSVCDLLSPRN